jgi:hypothetical protein
MLKKETKKLLKNTKRRKEVTIQFENQHFCRRPEDSQEDRAHPPIFEKWTIWKEKISG